MHQSEERPSKGRWMKLVEASQHLGLSEVTLRRRLKKGLLAYRMFEGRYFIWIDNSQIKAPPPNHEQQDLLIRRLKRQLLDQASLIELLEEQNRKLRQEASLARTQKNLSPSLRNS